MKRVFKGLFKFLLLSVSIALFIWLSIYVSLICMFIKGLHIIQSDIVLGYIMIQFCLLPTAIGGMICKYAYRYFVTEDNTNTVYTKNSELTSSIWQRENDK